MMAPSTAASGALTPRVRAALRLRARLLRLVGSGASGGESPSEPAVWELVLSSERCARPVARALGLAGARERLPAAGEVLRRRLAVESRRVLAARARLETLDRTARELGVGAVVLKGGAELTSERALDLGDLDVLVRAEEAEALVRALAARGYRRGPSAGTYHLAPLSGEGPVPIEVHFALSVAPVSGSSAWDDVEPLPGTEGLYRLGPADQLWHVLHHGALEHPNRRGRIRDLLLTARAVERCEPDAVGAVAEQAAAHPQAAPLTAQLAMARSLAAGDPVEDAFRAEAASHYLLWALLEPRGLPEVFSSQLFDAAVERLGSRVDRRRAWRKVGHVPEGVSGFGPVGGLERRVPALGRAWRLGLRVGRQALVGALAWPVAWWARRRAREVG